MLTLNIISHKMKYTNVRFLEATDNDANVLSLFERALSPHSIGPQTQPLPPETITAGERKNVVLPPKNVV